MPGTRTEAQTDPLRVAIPNTHRVDETLCLRERLQQARLLTGCLFAGQDSVRIGTEQLGREGSSGTGPKAGGPYYLHRLAMGMNMQREYRSSGWQ
jgi:delta 1-pyrroline-5-carboxylate dehydrogenase